MSVRTTYQITGMTCGHCAGAVTRELTALPGVREVEIDLAAGNAAVVSDAVLPLDEVRNAVDEAGYQLAGVDA
ncbi:metal-binding protein [Catellatospora methionotrophica]|uniref:Metal-binding protein n=1 Tax=Catellatospora methionotrophica TaxID=121620 RepID=A0A8J3LNI5_9ACTN|nr:heavy metal-associated domain-containing protein [Catellatospora methionotrophica]GIG18546.1 metal-binding protein [Catellatospora methionotrophica]